MQVPTIPQWITENAAVPFVSLVNKCPLCAWILLLAGMMGFFGCLWHFARAHRVAARAPRPAIATGGRALIGLVWIPALVVTTWVAGYRGLVPLLGDAIFVAFASLLALEWYAFWKLPPWAAKLTQLVVLGVYWWLSWRIALVTPTNIAWYVFMFAMGASSYVLAYGLTGGLTRHILFRNILPLIFLMGLFLPSQLGYVPEIPPWLLWGSLGLLFSWLGVFIGAFWLKVPEGVAGLVAPLWFVAVFVLGKLGVPGFVE